LALNQAIVPASRFKPSSRVIDGGQSGMQAPLSAATVHGRLTLRRFDAEIALQQRFIVEAVGALIRFV
jgi:hypothetical protein